VAPKSTSSWYWIEDTETSTAELYVVETGLIPVFKLYSSNVVYLHCNLQLCLIGEECPLRTEVVHSSFIFGPGRGHAGSGMFYGQLQTVVEDILFFSAFSALEVCYDSARYNYTLAFDI